jgi:hypothetical protein
MLPPVPPTATTLTLDTPSGTKNAWVPVDVNVHVVTAESALKVHPVGSAEDEATASVNDTPPDTTTRNASRARLK